LADLSAPSRVLLVKGAVLLALTELTPVASDAAMEAEARTALGRIP